MTKAEKKAFKLYAKRSSSAEPLFIKLFDILDNKPLSEDNYVIKALKLNSASKYSNLKGNLYLQILQSLRILKVKKLPNINIRNHIDMSYVLYDKGLYMQALKVLEHAKSLCHKYGTEMSLLTILEIEKTIHSRHITRMTPSSFNELISNVVEVSSSITKRVELSNLKMLLHRKYISKGHLKSKTELKELTKFFFSQINNYDYKKLKPYEKIYYCQCHVWYYFVIQEYKECQTFAIKWVDIFLDNQDLPKRDYNLFLRGYHYVLTASYNIGDKDTHDNFLISLEALRLSQYKKFNKNNKIYSFLYVHTGRFNKAFLDKNFEYGLDCIPKTLKRIKRYKLNLDQHKVMVLHYKIAWTYICALKPNKAIPYLEGIIKMQKQSLREDIQSNTRLIHLIALYDQSKYNTVGLCLKRYKYYFNKAKEVNKLQELTLKYFQDLIITPLLERNEIHYKFYKKLIDLKNSSLNQRSFLYLDIIFWVEKFIPPTKHQFS